MELSERVYRLTWTFPRQEMYDLSSQLQRASVSIPSNIAEGRMRGSLREYAHFIAMARGSLAELRTQLILAQRLEYSTVAASTELAEFAERLAQRLNALRKSLISRLDPERDQPKTEHRKPKTERGLTA
jgi:four helix bundle protein